MSFFSVCFYFLYFSKNTLFKNVILILLEKGLDSNLDYVFNRIQIPKALHFATHCYTSVYDVFFNFISSVWNKKTEGNIYACIYRLITGRRDGSLKIWNFNSGQCLKTLKKGQFQKFFSLSQSRRNFQIYSSP